MAKNDLVCLGACSSGVFYLWRGVVGLGDLKLVIRQGDVEIALDVHGIHAVECYARARRYL